MTCTFTMRYTELQIFLFLSICIPDLCHSQEPFAGPFKIVMRQMAQCEDSGTHQIYATSTRISRVSRTKYVYSTNITSEIEMSDDISIELELANFGNGGWRPHALQFEFPQQFCSLLKHMMPDFYNVLSNASHSECPFPPGSHELKDYDLERFRIPSLPNFPYGNYRVDLVGKINGTLIGCIRYYCDVVPAKREQPRKNRKNKS